MESFKLDFKLLLEGVECPFDGASVTATPHGVSAQVSLHSNPYVYELKPKTAVQIYFKGLNDDDEWRMMFDGYFSGVAEQSGAKQGNVVHITARDFRADAAKIPAYLMYSSLGSLGPTETMRTFYGVSDTSKSVNGETVSLSSRAYDTDRSSTGIGDGLKSVIDNVLQITGMGDNFGSLDANGALVLDAFAKGVWMESSSGTTYGSYMDKRVAGKKKMNALRNEAGYRIFRQNVTGTAITDQISGATVTTSVEALVMRIAAIYQMRPYSNSCPTLINSDNSSYFMSAGIFKAAGDCIAETTIMPPLEFTAPPNCNVILPSMYESVQLNFDYDSDATRALYHVTDLVQSGVNIEESLKTYIYSPANVKDPKFLSRYEKYIGVNPMYGQLFTEFASNDISHLASKSVSELMKKYNFQKNDSSREEILKRHAQINYINSRFAGRTCQVVGVFNPYVFNGLPGVIVAGKNSLERDVCGFVSIVTHNINVTSGGGSATTQVMLTNARYIDEATDFDDDGNPIFCVATDHDEAKLVDGVRRDPRVTVGFDGKYAKDFTTTPKNAKYTHISYIDPEYDPVNIHTFYKTGLKCNEDSIMVGGDFTYNTVHEAVDSFKRKNIYNIMHSLDFAYKFAERDICTLDEFIDSIMVINKEKYRNKETGNLIYSVIIPDEDLSSIDDEVETMYIKERRESVMNYIKAVHNKHSYVKR